MDLVGGYLCNCPNGFKGRNCEFNIDDCAGNLCQNGGISMDMVGGYECNCDDDKFSGDYCEKKVEQKYRKSPNFYLQKSKGQIVFWNKSGKKILLKTYNQEDNLQWVPYATYNVADNQQLYIQAKGDALKNLQFKII